MREILFRGKRLDNGEWVEGFYYVKRLRHKGEKALLMKEQSVITSGIKELSGAYGESAEYLEWKVDPSTVGQYIGLEDAKGKKIFDGDIVRGYSDYHDKFYGSPAVVGYGHFNCDCCGGVYGWYFGEYGEGDIRDVGNCLVIGNIHDNPELLKGESDG